MTGADMTTMQKIKEARRSVPVNLEALANRLGVLARSEALPEHICGCLHRRSDVWVIVVNADHAPTRKRFTLAHELGHLVWHRPILGDGTNDTRKYSAEPGYRFYNDAIGRRHEREANQFATSLLMPSDMVRHVHNSAGVHAPELLAVVFGVSPEAMAIRVDSLAQRDML